MEKLLGNRELSIEENQSNLKTLKEAFRQNETSSDVKMERIHIDSINPNGRTLKGKTKLLIYISIKESSIHNNLMHDCNRHRENGYMDVTWASKIPEEFIEEF